MQPGRRATVVESSGGQPPRRSTLDDADRLAAAAAQRHAGGSGAPRRRTEYIFDPTGKENEAGKAGAKAADQAKTRKIVAVLVTYTWTDEGQVFPVFEGRNRIGRDATQCEIAIPQDESLSAVNSHILYRKNFVIGDDVSMNGTFVDGEPVETQFFPLRNYAQIRTGSTAWTFIAVQPSAVEQGEAAPESTE
ncbi:MAG TPA: FHA domain-containing protein [Terracidiphilus sp.]|nr:FHA domain-containing protein [Terracidiphilus sp.]